MSVTEKEIFHKRTLVKSEIVRLKFSFYVNPLLNLIQLLSAPFVSGNCQTSKTVSRPPSVLKSQTQVCVTFQFFFRSDAELI